jgi:subtilisin family serine protease
MVGDDGKGRQIGVAPAAQWIGCRNMKNGVGSVASYLECFEFFLAPYPLGGDPQKDGRPDLAPHIVNNSWSCPVDEGCTGNEFLGVVQAYKAAGILLVSAASNNGPNCGTVSDAPAKYAGEILTVGAYNTFLNEIAFFSALGPATWKGQLAPNVIAPGDFIVSAITKGPDSYEDKPGTSMASPQAAGVAALLWSYRPELIGQIDATIDIIQKSARGMPAKTSCPGFPGSKVPNAAHGYGMLDAYKALNTP